MPYSDRSVPLKDIPVHRSMEGALMYQQTTDLKSSVTELLYGTSFLIPGEFCVNEDIPADPQFFAKKFHECVQQSLHQRLLPENHDYSIIKISLP